MQVSRDRKILLTASFGYLSSVIYCKKGHCLETVKFNGCILERSQYSHGLFRAKTLINWLYCNVGCHITRNRLRKIYGCKCIMLESYIFRQTSGNFCRRQTTTILWRLSLGMGSFAKDYFHPLVNRISIKTLEKY